MLRRLITIVFLLALAGFIASFLEAQPGVTQIEWLGWRVEARTSLLVAVAIGVIWLAISFDRVLGYLVGLPGRIKGGFSERRRNQGHHALALGLIAASAGDGREALKQSKRAQRLVGSDTLTGLLSAQAAQLNGDHAAASRFFEALAEDRDTAFLGKAGLMRLEAEDGRDDAALDAGRAAFKMNKNAPSLAKALFTLEARHGYWQNAIDALNVAKRDHEMNNADIASAFAALHFNLALEAEGDDKLVLRNLEKALKHDAGFTPAVLALSAHEALAKKPRKRITILTQGFAQTPHPDVAATLIEAWGDGAAALAKLIALTAKNGNPPEALVASARIAASLELWGEAVRLIRLVPEERRSISAWQLLADLADHKPEDNSAELDWPDRNEALSRAASAHPPAMWKCRSCATPHMAWQSNCSGCNGFAQIHFS